MSADVERVKAITRGDVRVSVAALERGHDWARFELSWGETVFRSQPVRSVSEAFEAANSAAAVWGILNRPLIPNCTVRPSNNGFTAEVVHWRGCEQIIVTGDDWHPLGAALQGWCTLFNFLSCCPNPLGGTGEVF